MPEDKRVREFITNAIYNYDDGNAWSRGDCREIADTIIAQIREVVEGLRMEEQEVWEEWKHGFNLALNAVLEKLK